MKSAVLALLYTHDPMGIAHPNDHLDAANEYAPEAESMIPLLMSNMSAADCQRLVWQTMCQWFSAGTAGPIEDYQDLGTDLWRLVQTSEQRSSSLV